MMEVPPKLFSRVGAHSHIKGLGLEGLKAKPIADGMVGQIKAREAAGIVTKLINEGKMAGRAILLAGPPGTGKTAIAVGITRELGEGVPFVQISGSEIYSGELKKTEVLMQAMRKAIGVKIHENRKIYEGEVASLSINTVQNPYNPYQRIPESCKITLRTKDEKKTLEAGRGVATQIIQQGVEEGDIILIDAETGRVTKLGKSIEYKTEKKYDIETERLLPVPEGSILKTKEFVYTVSLHDLDESRAKRAGGFFSILFGGAEEKEVGPEIRAEVDEYVKSLVEAKGKEETWAEIIPGVLFIEECHMLDIEAFSFLNRAMETELAPIIILTTNRGMTKIRGTDIVAPHGIPLDLLDRLFIINTHPYNKEEIAKILEIRAKEEGAKLADESKKLLTEIGFEKSLRYAVQLIAASQTIAKEEGKELVEPEHVKKAEELFSDLKRSVGYLKRYEEQMLG